MCIIIYSPAGTELPSKNRMRTCWNNNSDGAGYMKVDDDGMCHIKKGFMSFKSLLKAYNAERFTKNDTVIIHFRIGTSGKDDATCTHPFPITDSIADLRQTEFQTDLAFAHNGIIGEGDDKKGLSDTMIFSMEVLNNLKKHLDEREIMDMISNITAGSRLLIVCQGVVWLTGSWITDKKTGIYYSNSTYKKRKYTTIGKGYNWEHSDDRWLFKKSDYDWKDAYNKDKEIEEDLIPKCPSCNTINAVADMAGFDKSYECFDCGINFEKDPDTFEDM